MVTDALSFYLDKKAGLCVGRHSDWYNDQVL